MVEIKYTCSTIAIPLAEVRASPFVFSAIAHQNGMFHSSFESSCHALQYRLSSSVILFYAPLANAVIMQNHNAKPKHIIHIKSLLMVRDELHRVEQCFFYHHFFCDTYHREVLSSFFMSEVATLQPKF